MTAPSAMLSSRPTGVLDARGSAAPVALRPARPGVCAALGCGAPRPPFPALARPIPFPRVASPSTPLIPPRCPCGRRSDCGDVLRGARTPHCPLPLHTPEIRAGNTLPLQPARRKATEPAATASRITAASLLRSPGRAAVPLGRCPEVRRGGNALVARAAAGSDEADGAAQCQLSSSIYNY